jgi:hypothetical protein
MIKISGSMFRNPLLLGILGSIVTAATLLSQPSAPPINVYDGFDGPSLSNLWNTISIAPNSVRIQSSIVRAGHGALRIDLHSHDIFLTGRDGDADSERDELLEARPLSTRQNKLYDFSWSMYLPPDFPVVPVRLVVAQWWEYCPRTDLPCSNDSPVLAVRYIGGILSITQDLNHRFIVLYQEKRDLRGKWIELRFEVRFSPHPDGQVRAWLQDKLVVDYSGIAANTANTATGYPDPSYFPFKMGLYRNVMPQPMTIYLDEYRKRQLP